MSSAEEDASVYFAEFMQFIKCLQKFGFRSDTGGIEISQIRSLKNYLSFKIFHTFY